MVYAANIQQVNPNRFLFKIVGNLSFALKAVRTLYFGKQIFLYSNSHTSFFFFFNVSKVKFITKILEAYRMDRRLGISSESRQKPRCSAVWGQEVGLIGILLERRERGQACLVVKGEAPYVSPGVSREHLVASAPLPCERGRNSHWHPLGLVEGGLAPGFRDPWRKYLVGVPFFPKKKEKVQWC